MTQKLYENRPKNIYKRAIIIRVTSRNKPLATTEYAWKYLETRKVYEKLLGYTMKIELNILNLDMWYSVPWLTSQTFLTSTNCIVGFF